MSIYWVRTSGNSAIEAMKAIAEALRQDERGVAPVEDQGEAVSNRVSNEVINAEEEFAQTNLRIMHTAWSIDPIRPVLTDDRRLLARLRIHAQHVIRRLTRWYVLSPWLQANEFHAAVVRITDVLLVRQQRMRQELSDYQYRLQAAEQQIQILRNELAIAHQQIMELRQMLHQGRFDQE